MSESSVKRRSISHLILVGIQLSLTLSVKSKGVGRFYLNRQDLLSMTQLFLLEIKLFLAKSHHTKLCQNICYFDKIKFLKAYDLFLLFLKKKNVFILGMVHPRVFQIVVRGGVGDKFPPPWWERESEILMREEGEIFLPGEGNLRSDFDKFKPFSKLKTDFYDQWTSIKSNST